MVDAKSIVEIGEPYKINTMQEACYQCGIVQQMEIYKQEYENHPDGTYPKGNCPVCGNNHSKNPPW